MRSRIIVGCLLLAALAAPAALALNPDDELWIPAAARGAGKAGSFWVTDLVVMNLGEEDVTVVITWLERNADNSEAEGVEYTIAGGATLTLEDVVMSAFGKETAYGGLHIEVVEDEEEEAAGVATAAYEEDEDPEIIANARVYNRSGSRTLGQGLEGFTSVAIIAAEDDDTTHVVGVSDDEQFRSNWYGQNTSEEETVVEVALLDGDGDVVASDSFTLPPLAPVLFPVSDLSEDVIGDATMRFTVTEGEGIFGVSKVDRLSNDPTTLEPHWDCEDDDDEEFTDEFAIDECTLATTGRNHFFVLEPGFQLVLEGEDDGEELELVITVLDETEVVDGVTTRVLEERESVGGELVEVSRNYFTFCIETGSVFYHGEDVDNYEGGVVVDHGGSWRAGSNGAVPGMFMPGAVLLGSRYYQEIAPDVALDRAEHVALDAEVETEAGTFTHCLKVEETTPLEPGSESIKIYAPGIGLIVDDDAVLVEYTDPSAP